MAHWWDYLASGGATTDGAATTAWHSGLGAVYQWTGSGGGVAGGTALTLGFTSVGAAIRTAFQQNVFQADAFQIVAEATVTAQPSGGYGFGAYDRTLHRRRKVKEELADEIAALEQHLAEVQKVPRETIRIRAAVRSYAAPLPPKAKRVVNAALKVPTIERIERAEQVLAALEEEEDFTALLLVALH